jgi:hypothetical protein
MVHSKAASKLCNFCLPHIICGLHNNIGRHPPQSPFLSCEMDGGAEQWQRIWRTILVVEHTVCMKHNPLPLPAFCANCRNAAFIGRRQFLGVSGVAIVVDGGVAMATGPLILSVILRGGGALGWSMAAAQTSPRRFLEALWAWRCSCTNSDWVVPANRTEVPCSNSDKTQNFTWLTPDVNFLSLLILHSSASSKFHHPNRFFFFATPQLPSHNPPSRTYVPNRICSGG